VRLRLDGAKDDVSDGILVRKAPMKSTLLPALVFALVHCAICGAKDNPKPENATAVLRAFETHDIVLIGEIHSNKQEYDWYRSLVTTPEFADRVDDIVLEMGNSLYQEVGQPKDPRINGSGMLDLERRFYRVGPEFPDYVDVLNAAGYVQRFVEFAQDEVTELVPLVLFGLIAPRRPHIAFRKLT
jgi:hypothetical protein